MKKLTVLSALVALPLLSMAQNVAIVNGKAVPKTRVTAFVKELQEQGQQIPPGAEVQVRDEVVRREIWLQEAERRGLAATPEYKAQMESIRQNLLISLMFSQYAKTAPVSKEELTAEYNKAIPMLEQNKQSQTRISHIVVEKEEEAKQIISQLRAGVKFEELAKARSQDTGSAATGGDINWQDNARLPEVLGPDLSAAVTKLEKGQFSTAPVKSPMGFHVLMVTDVRTRPIPSMDDVKPQLEQIVRQRKLIEFQQDMIKKAKTDYKFSAMPPQQGEPEGEHQHQH